MTDNRGILKTIKSCRSIRKYSKKQVSREELDSIIEAGLYAANAGGAQRSMIVALHDAELAKQVGRLNMAHFDRSALAGSYVSREQPSVIDDPAIKNGFYDAPTVLCVFNQEHFAFSIADAFVAVEAMALQARSLGVSSCIVSRAEQTFRSERGQELVKRWGVPNDYVCRAFLALGYCDGPYPEPKPRRQGRVKIIEAKGQENE